MGGWDSQGRMVTGLLGLYIFRCVEERSTHTLHHTIYGHTIFVISHCYHLCHHRLFVNIELFHRLLFFLNNIWINNTGWVEVEQVFGMNSVFCHFQIDCLVLPLSVDMAHRQLSTKLGVSMQKKSIA